MLDEKAKRVLELLKESFKGGTFIDADEWLEEHKKQEQSRVYKECEQILRNSR